MKESKDHLDIDLEFLDKKEPLRVAPKPHEQTSSTSKSPSTGRKYNWKNILIIVGIVLFFGWVILSESGSSSTSSDPIYSNNLLSEGGQTFRCSDSNYDRAMALKPSVSLGAQLANESDSLDSRIAANKSEKVAIENMYVDENDEYEVDNYNSRVDSYNSERQRLITASNSWDQRSKAFDASIDTYNNFLDTNCTPQ